MIYIKNIVTQFIGNGDVKMIKLTHDFLLLFLVALMSQLWNSRMHHGDRSLPLRWNLNYLLQPANDKNKKITDVYSYT